MKTIFAVAATMAAACVAPTAANAYVIATANTTLNNTGWALGGAYMTGFRSTLGNTALFGAGGTVGTALTINDLGTVTAATLSGADAFFSTYWSDSASASSVTAVVNFFLAGGDLFLAQDSASYDAIGAALGIPTVASTGTASNGASPLFTGPFGTAANVTQSGTVGSLAAASVTAKNGTIGATNTSGQITAAYWNAGQYAVGAGRLVILADVDMVSNTATTYTPLNANGRFALNSVAFLTGGAAVTGAVPEPATWAMMVLGFASLGHVMRRRPKSVRVRFA